MKGIRLCVWRTKNLSIIGSNLIGSNLTHVNYPRIVDQVRFIDTMEFYQQSFEKLAETVTEIEK